MTDTVVGLDVDDLKDHLRYKLRHTRAAYSHPSRRHDARCAALAENVFQALNGAQAVAAYVSVGDEPCTRLLIDELHAAGVQVLLPVLGPHLSRSWGWFRGSDDLATRAPGRPPEPSGLVLGPAAITLVQSVLVPALAVDAHGNRLGQGGGWYDRMLPLVNPGVETFALLHPNEYLTDTTLPTAEFDRPVSGIITTEGITRF